MTKKPEPVVAEVKLKRIPERNEQYYRYHKRAADLLRAVIKHAPDKGASGLLLHESIIPKNNPLVAHPHLVLQEQHGQLSLSLIGILNGVLGTNDVRLALILNDDFVPVDVGLFRVDNKGG